MARCFSCGKTFDYEKYYGICPKCGAYNKKNTVKEEHEEFHRAYDTADVPSSHYEGHSQNTWESQNNTSSSGKILFVCLIFGIILGILIPVLFIIRSISGSMSGNIQMGIEEINRAEYGVTVIPHDAGEVRSLGLAGEVQITVNSAKVIVPAGWQDDFPEGEKLIGINVKYDNTYTYLDYPYYGTDIIYIGYGENRYKYVLYPDDFEKYPEILEDNFVLEPYDVCLGQGEGNLLVFVPDEVEEICVYLESRNEKNYELVQIYEIPLKIEAGEGM